MIPHLCSFLVSLASNGVGLDAAPDAILGAPHPLKATTAQILSETLSVVIEEDSARIHARYWIQNDGDTLRAPYGAPIDFHATNFLDAAAWDTRTFSRAKFRVDGGKPARMKPGPILLASTGKRLKDTTNAGERPLRRWFTAPMILPPGLHRLDLHVTSTGSLWDSEVKGEENLAEFSPRTMHWDFRPAKNWGTGIVHDFLLTVDVSDLDRKAITFKSNGPSLTREGNLWVHRATDLDLGRMDNANWIWFSNAYKKEKYFLSNAVWENPPWRGSSNLPDYPLSSLSDNDFSTAWVAPNNGAKAWLDVTIPDSIHLGYIQITPGFCKSVKLWSDNSRLKNFTINGHPAAQASGGAPPDSIPRRIGELDLFRVPGCRPGFDEGYSKMEPPPKHIRIEFTDVEPGQRFKDLPISEIVLLGCPSNQ
ncbi:MAG: hypothetical protein IPN71_03560 [Fibrobacteres bacterium]|nr:hypothetical protein [Fibrobacterota bacterium]